MPNPNAFPSSNSGDNFSQASEQSKDIERTAEELRGTYQVRGEKTEKAKRIAELLARKAAIQKEREEILARLAVLDPTFVAGGAPQSGQTSQPNQTPGQQDPTQPEQPNQPQGAQSDQLSQPQAAQPQSPSIPTPIFPDSPSQGTFSFKESLDYSTPSNSPSNTPSNSPSNTSSNTPSNSQPNTPPNVPSADPSSTSANAANSEETITASAVAEKAKKNPSLKSILIGATATALAAVIGLSAFGGLSAFKKQNQNNKNQDSEPGTISGGVITENVNNISPTNPENQNTEKGIIDGYDKTGMFLSEHKAGPYNFANATEVAELFGNDEVEMLKYTARNQVESFADYLANLPAALQPEGLKGLTLGQTEKKLEDLNNTSKTAYDQLRQEFDKIMDNAYTRRVVLNGQYDNAYMDKIDKNGPAVHDNMRLIKWTSTEHNLEATEFYWLDENGQEIGSMICKMTPIYDEQGNIVSFSGCEQGVVKTGSTPVHNDIPAAPAEPEPEQKSDPGSEPGNSDPGTVSGGQVDKTPDPTGTISGGSIGETPTPNPAPTPTGTISGGSIPTPPFRPTPPRPNPNPGPTPVDTPLAPKNPQAEIRNAGPNVDQRSRDDNETPFTTYEQDQANFDRIEDRVQQDIESTIEAFRAEQEQAERERQAAEEAEQRRNEQTEEAANRQAELEREARESEEVSAREAAQAELERQAEAVRQANEAIADAYEQSSETQAEAAPAEQAAAFEQETRETLQENANEAAEAGQANAEQMSVNNEARDAADFANGAFDLNF